MSIELITYNDVLREIPNTKHLLLGNGFSIACSKKFEYPNLFEYVKKTSLNPHVLKVFEYLGTNNFEGVMRLLEDSKWIAKHYGLERTKGVTASISEDLASIKKSLVSAIAKTHLPNPSTISDDRKNQCVSFLEPYQNVFTTDYDLLLYWVANHGQEKLKEQDGFRASVDDPRAEYLVFSEHIGQNKGILFLHGALHLYVEGGETRKHSWVRSNKSLIELVKKGLENGQYPLFVAEGKAEKKMAQIQRSGYLFYCLGKFERIASPLVIYGLSFSENDQHIIHAIADNRDLDRVFIGLHGRVDSRVNKQIIHIGNWMTKRRKDYILTAKGRRAKELDIKYFNSKTTPVWD